MKNFLDLLATEFTLDVCVNGQIYAQGLHDCLIFESTDTVTIDDIEILPKYSYLSTNGKLVINEPFYHWYHRVTSQGWLLVPQ